MQHLEIERAIAALERQRALLDEQVVEASLAALRRQLRDAEAEGSPVPGLKAERRQVTVMFADISGFTAMSEKLDPEEVRSLINACFERLGAVIQRYDGYIDKFIGDEIMALFGAPVAHENDPERALRAALDMISTLAAFNAEHADLLPTPLTLHFGVNTGLVIAGGIGTSRRQDYSVLGDAVNLASRLEDLSEAGDILVGEDTYRLTAPLFDFEPPQPVMVKGKQKPVQVYRLLKARAAPGRVRGIEGLSSPLVGRDAELAQLAELLTRFQRGQGGTVSVIADAGLGKSRLVAELRRLNGSPGPLLWATGRALSFGENLSYLVVRDALRNLLGAGPEAKPAEVARALEAEISQLLPQEAAAVKPYLAHLLELPLDDTAAQRVKYLDGEALHRQILQAVEKYIAAKTRQTPLALIWEDLHWADPFSLELLETLVPLTRQCRLLLLLIYRPMREKRVWAFHDRLADRANGMHTGIELAPLSREESDRLLANLLDVRNLAEQTRQLILDKAEGNPFFLEEVIRSLIDSGLVKYDEAAGTWVARQSIDTIKIPDTLQGVIMARVDRLDPEAKRILQVASVIGRTFHSQVLATVLAQIAGGDTTR